MQDADGDTPASVSEISQVRLLPGHTPTCFGCGPENTSSLGLQVYRTQETIFADYTFDEQHIGGPGLAHGGAIAAVCDELLGFSVWLIGAPAVTRALTIDYLCPVALGVPHRITARIDGEKGRAILMSAQGVSEQGTTSFTAKGVYVRVPFEHFDDFGTPDTPVDDLQVQLSRESGR